MAKANPIFPEIVGASEACKMCDFGIARLYQLRKEGRFPEPYIKLKCGPIWLRSTIYAFLESYDRSTSSRPNQKPSSDALSVP